MFLFHFLSDKKKIKNEIILILESTLTLLHLQMRLVGITFSYQNVALFHKIIVNMQ